MKHAQTGSSAPADTPRPGQTAGYSRCPCDLTLPDARGLAAVTALVADGLRPPPLVVLTEDSDAARARAALARGAQDYLVKQDLTPDSLARAAVYARQRHHAEQARHLVAARLQGVMDNAVDAIITITEDGIILDANPATETLFGWPRHELTGHNVSCLMPPGDAAAHDGYLTRYLSGGTPRILGRRRTVTGRHRDGRLLRLDLAVSEAVTDQGRVFTGILRDVGETERLLISLREAKAAAEAANQAKSNFLSAMSHELRTPLNAILGFAQLIQHTSGAQVTPRHAGYLDHILTGGQHLLALINEILDLARIEAGRVDLSPAALDPAVVVAECLATLRPLAESRGLTVADHTGGGPGVWADPQRLQQVLINLISNAIKYNREGGRLTVTWTPADSPALVRLVVADTGTGLTEAQMAQLFQPFNRVGAERGHIEGTGIGLALVKRLVELMQGTVGVDSVPSVGTAFWVDLPRSDRPTDAPQSPDTPTVPPSLHPGLDGGPLSVMVVEDTPANAALLEAALTDYGARVTACKTAEAALARLENGDRPAVVVMDLTLPGMDGVAALAVLREWHPALPVVALTADAMPATLERLGHAGFDAILTKPVALARLFRTLNALAGG